MLSFNRFENSRPEGAGVLEVGSGKWPRKTGPRQFAPLKTSELQGVVCGPIANLRLVQVFEFSSAESQHAIQAFYRLPLPGDAAVKSVCVRFGDVELQAELKKRTQATEDYDNAMKKARQAALITRESDHNEI